MQTGPLGHASPRRPGPDDPRFSLLPPTIIHELQFTLSTECPAGVSHGAADAHGSRAFPSDLRTLVLLPAFNEESSVGEVVRRTMELGFPAVVIDDGSADRTAEVAEMAGATVLRLPVNLGVGGALRLGFRYAVQHEFNVVVQCDADGQHAPEEIAQLLGALVDEGADMAIGSRFSPRPEQYQVGGPRRAAMRLLATIATRAARQPITDSTSGFRAIRQPLLGVFSVSYPAEYLGDTVEALIEAGRAGYRIVEAPVHMNARATGQPSAPRLASIWYILRVLVVVALRAGRRAGNGRRA